MKRKLTEILVLAFLGIWAAAAPADAQGLNPNPPATTVKLIFIHHSTGEGWLADGGGNLGQTLMDNNYFVSDTNYTWGPDEIGSRTDIGHWHDWFLGTSASTYVAALYAESEQHASYTRLEPDPGGANEVVMFKSCFPNSTIYGSPSDPPISTSETNPIYGQWAGDSSYTVANVKGLYRDLLTYFATRQDKLFILIVTPPLIAGATNASEAANARAVANWLMNDWLTSYPYANVRAFDYFNVLTSNGGTRNTNDLGTTNGNHHRYWNGAIQHIQTVASNYCAYGSGDSHPTAAGQQKATGEFVPLLNIWYNAWKGNSGPSLDVTAPAAGSTWYTGSAQTITWAKSGEQAAQVKIELFKGTTKVLTIASATDNDEAFDWTPARSQAAASNYRIRITTSDGLLRAESDVFAIARPSITVTAPARGDVWLKGSDHTITWSKSGPQDANVTLELLRSGIKVLTIVASTSNAGSFPWTVPATLKSSTAYKVRIKTLDGTIKAQSGGFTIR